MNFIKKIFFLSIIVNISLYCAQPAKETKYQNSQEECDAILKRINSPKGRKLLQKISKMISKALRQIPKSKSNVIEPDLLNKINRFIKARLYVVTLINFYEGINEVENLYDEESIIRQGFYIDADEATQKALLVYIKNDMCKLLNERKKYESQNQIIK